MKIKFILLLAIGFPALLQAQITVNVVLPPAGMVTKDQLWNLVLTNNSNTGSQVTILMNLKDVVTGQPVLSAGTRGVLLNKGVKVLTIKDIQPVQYTSGAGNATANFLPLGSYIACYTVSNYNHELLQTLATECVRINITPLSPPLLSTPVNRSILQTPAPQLTWIPPAPLDMFDNLTYELSIAEILEGQSPAEAVRYNTPVYASAHLKAPYENYPSTFSALKAGKTYAWQVTARNGDNYASATEVWTFTIGKDSVKKEESQDGYISINTNGNGADMHVVTGNELRIKYYSFDKTHETVVRIQNAERNLIQEVKQTLVYGDNYLLFKLGSRYHKGKPYILEITDQSNNKYSTAFSIK
jgi:hypothetical protein